MSPHMELGAATQPGQNQDRFLDKRPQATMQHLGTRPRAGVHRLPIAVGTRSRLKTPRVCIILSGHKARRVDWRSHSRPGTEE